MENKILSKVKETFKKASKKSRLAMAKKYGFETIEAFQEYLNSPVEKVLKEQEALENTESTDIVIAFDTTGSMSSYIQAVKKHVTELIPTLFSETKNLRLSIVAFGDYVDTSLPKNYTMEQAMGDLTDGYQYIDFTTDTNKLIEFVQKAKNTRGGDGPEFYDLVLCKIRTQLSWKSNSNKSILLIADAPCHTPLTETSDGYNNLFNWIIEASHLNQSKIKVDTLACTGEKWYKEISKRTGGIYLLFGSSSKTNDLLKGYTYARTGSTVAFEEERDRIERSGDAELTGVYKQLGTL